MGYRTDLHILRQGSTTASQYQNGFLDISVILYFTVACLAFDFSNDNAHPHIAVNFDNYVASEEIANMEWLTYLSDFNPIHYL